MISLANDWSLSLDPHSCHPSIVNWSQETVERCSLSTVLIVSSSSKTLQFRIGYRSHPGRWYGNDNKRKEENSSSKVYISFVWKTLLLHQFFNSRSAHILYMRQCIKMTSKITLVPRKKKGKKKICMYCLSHWCNKWIQLFVFITYFFYRLCLQYGCSEKFLWL